MLFLDVIYANFLWEANGSPIAYRQKEAEISCPKFYPGFTVLNQGLVSRLKFKTGKTKFNKKYLAWYKEHRC